MLVTLGHITMGNGGGLDGVLLWGECELSCAHCRAVRRHDATLAGSRGRVVGLCVRYATGILDVYLVAYLVALQHSSSNLVFQVTRVSHVI